MRNYIPFNLDDAIPRSIRDACQVLEDAGMEFNFHPDASQSLRLRNDAVSTISPQMPAMPSIASFPRGLRSKLLAADQVLRQKNIMQISLCYGFCAELRKSGVKVFRPSLEQCVAMEQVSLDIPLRDYRQPYQVIIIEYPSEYARMRQMQYRYAVCHHSDKHLAVWRRYSDELDDTFASSLEERTLEEALHLRARAEFQFPSKEAVRVAINCCMLLANYPVQLRSMGSASVIRTNRERARRLGRRYLPPREITLVQNIAFHEEHNEVQAPQTESSNDLRHRPQPHWRRGHWRKQAFGPGRARTKVIFIRPILVNAKLSHVDPAQRQVIYGG